MPAVSSCVPSPMRWIVLFTVLSFPEDFYVHPLQPCNHGGIVPVLEIGRDIPRRHDSPVAVANGDLRDDLLVSLGDGVAIQAGVCRRPEGHPFVENQGPAALPEPRATFNTRATVSASAQRSAREWFSSLWSVLLICRLLPSAPPSGWMDGHTDRHQYVVWHGGKVMEDPYPDLFVPSLTIPKPNATFHSCARGASGPRKG